MRTVRRKCCRNLWKVTMKKMVYNKSFINYFDRHLCFYLNVCRGSFNNNNNNNNNNKKYLIFLSTRSRHYFLCVLKKMVKFANNSSNKVQSSFQLSVFHDNRKNKHPLFRQMVKSQPAVCRLLFLNGSFFSSFA